MNITFSVPFAQIKVINAQAEHDAFFKKIYFKQTYKTPTLIKVNLTIKKIEIRKKELLQSESSCFDGSHFYILDTKQKKACIDFHLFTKRNIAITVEPDFDLYYLFTFVIEPLLVIISAQHDIIYFHSSSVVTAQGRAIIFPAWRHTGKTQSILNLTQQGYQFLGDDYTVVHDKFAYLYPKNINLFSYNFAQNPELYKKISPSLAWKLRFFSKLKQFLFYISQQSSGAISKIFFRVSQLAEVATNTTLSPLEIAVTAQTAKVGKFIFLQKSTVTSSMQATSKKQFTDKSTAVILYELHEFFSLYLQFQFLLQKKVTFIDTFEAQYRKILSNVVSSAFEFELSSDDSSLAEKLLQ